MRERKPISPAQRALGMAIRAERVKAAYSQERFARHAGIDRAYYGAVERGEFNLRFSTLVRVASGLGVGPGAICTSAEAIEREMGEET
ncbi:MAG TPA: helix-turn-helix transcriptional regulator [Solirubrobacteraceae bacterium]|nr:helix-turn-helix transcriptional regulator [Solirubrobacteraceae bacterium]